MSVQGYWADLPSHAFEGLPGGTIAILPIGATEQHGPHLPVSVDAALIDAVTTRAMKVLDPVLNVLVLPTLTVTKSGEHDCYPGTLSLSGDTLMAVLRDTAGSVAHAGIERLVLFNGHGGNTAVLEMAARDMRIEQNLIVVSCSWFGFAMTDGLLDDSALSHDLHAGFIETSAMLAVRPDLVDMERAKNFRTVMQDWAHDFPAIGLSGQPARPGWIMADLNIEGACGNAAAATTEAGEQLLTTAADRFAGFLKDFARFDHRGEPQ